MFMDFFTGIFQMRIRILSAMFYLAFVSDDSQSLMPDNNDDQLCPRNRDEAVYRGRTCLRKCNTDADCISSRKRCLCDGFCGMSCVRPDLNCDELAEPNNGRILFNNNFFNSRVTYECDTGYYMFGPRERICQGDSSWSDNPPECKPRPLCGSPPNIPHSKHSAIGSPITEFELNTTLTYECFNGYEAQGSVTSMCQQRNETTNWLGPELRCIPISCGDPGEVDNGYRESLGNQFTARVSYFCNDGYILSGRAIRYCQSNGQWSGDLPNCQPVKCSQPEDPNNGRAFYESITFGSVVQYQCKSDYQLKGPYNRTCQSNRQWSGEEPECKLIDCGPPGIFPNGYIEVHSTYIGSMIRFFCFDTMVYEGEFNSSTCTSNGTWSPFPFPRCLAQCTVPEIINGQVENYPPLTRIPHGHQINVTCIDQFELYYEHDKIFCNNGTWSQLPNCAPARCKTLPPKPKHGIVIAPKMEHGMRALFRCRDGYQLEGPDITWCHFGRWNVSTPKCIQIYCPFPGFLPNGKVMLVGHMGMYDYRPYVRRVPNNKQILFECDRGYHIISGPPGSTCVDGKWSPSDLPQCERFYYPKLLRWNRSIRDGEAKRKLLSHHNRSIHAHRAFTSVHGYFPSIRSAFRHKRHQQKHKSACLHLPEKVWMNISIIRLGHGNETYPHGTRIRLICEDGFVLSNPNRTVIKCAKGRWKPELPDCLPASCITPTIANAKFFINRKRLQSGQLVKHSNQIELICDDGYQQPPPFTNVTLRCAYGSWDARASEICLPLPCMLPYIMNGYYVDGNIKPGQQVEHDTSIQYRCESHYKVSTEEYPRCILGKIEPELPLCVEDYSKPKTIVTTIATTTAIPSTVKDVENFHPEKPNKENSTEESKMEWCKSPQKIENALLYFDQLFSSKLTLIGVAQLDQTETEQNDNQTTYYHLNSEMPYKYAHGTEIMFRCVSYARSRSSNVNDVSSRSTWIIRCEDGNWIGRSFECQNDMDNNDRQTELLSTVSFPTTEPTTTTTTYRPESRHCLLQISDPNVFVFVDDVRVETNTTLPQNTTITIRCRDIGRYKLVGPKQRQCHNGMWNKVEPVCVGLSQEYNYSLEKAPTILFRNQIGPIAQSPDGKLIVYPGTILHLDCLWKRRHGTPVWSWNHPDRFYLQYWTTEPGNSSLEYKLTIFHAQEQDSGTYTCQTPNFHIHSVEVKVKAVHCPPINLTRNLRIVEDNGDRMNSKVLFACSEGTTIIGESSITCFPSGRWSDNVPTCNVTQCPDLTFNQSNVATEHHYNQYNHVRETNKIQPAQILQTNRNVGDKLVFNCPKGYGLQGSHHELYCLETGEWSGSVPYCQEVKCDKPKAPENGFIENIKDPLTPYFAGDIVQFACAHGFMLDGNPISVCQENGRWSGPITKCKPACTYPGVMHGSRLLSEVKFFYQLNETIMFECIDGYQLNGNPTIKCISSGRWSGPVPECVPVS